MRINYSAEPDWQDRLRPYLIGEGPREDGEWDMYCPLHEDNNRSAQLNVDEGVWYCHAGCGGGTLGDLLEREDEWVPREAVAASAASPRVRRAGGVPEELSEAAVRRWSRALLDNPARQDEFFEARGLGEHIIIQFEIGWDDTRRAYTIPIRDREGELQNIRRYQIHPPSGRRKMWSANGHGSPVLYPIQQLLSTGSVIVCEGELDALICIQNGFPAVTRTASAITWKMSWNGMFKDKTVYVCHDADKAGTEANKRVLKALDGIAREVRVVQLPYAVTPKHGKDLTDWWLEYGEADEFKKMLSQGKRGTVIRLAKTNGKVHAVKTEEEKQQVEDRDPYFAFTDDGNKRRFIEQWKGRLIYCPGVGWHVWSKQHHTHDSRDRRLWRPVSTEQVVKYAMKTAYRLREEALEIDDFKLQIAALKHAKNSLEQPRLARLVKLAQSGDPELPDLTVAVSELDTNKDIINTPSGIVDLKTGKLRKHDPNEFCTMITNAPYDPAADRAAWYKFLNRIMPDEALQSKLQMMMGASITGRPVRAVGILYGPEGENGKSQLIEAIQLTLGSYASASSESTFTNAGSREAATDLARFRGIRFVSVSETISGRGLAAERIKRITGDDMITARALYQNPFSYRPDFKLWFGTNHAPTIPAGEKALWKRVWVWGMYEVIPKNEQVPDLGRLLARKHGAAILSWLVDGAKAFYFNDCRLGAQPEKMELIRSQWHQRDDIVGRWIEERTTPLVQGRVRFSDCYRDFKEWIEEQGEQMVGSLYTAQKFHAEVDDHGYQRSEKKSEGQWMRLGLALNNTALRGVYR